MIIRGGENIYPKEIENALATHADILEAAVVGAPDVVYGEVPIAYVVTYPNAAVHEAELLDHLRERIAKIKLPVAIHIIDALPRNPVGKIDKPGLRLALQASAVETVS
jgi:long-chain acyl-CoA synthetase